MKDLIEKLAKLKSPCRNMDAQITVACDLRPEYVPSDSKITPFNGYIVSGEDVDGPSYVACDYTASIDSALMLVPKGWRWSVDSNGARSFGAVVENEGLKAEPCFFSHHRRSPALALCTAALKARQFVRGRA